MNLVETIIDKYYFFHTEILHISLTIFTFITVIGFILLKYNKENIRYIFNKLIYKVINSAIIVYAVYLLCLMGLKLEIEYIYFNVYFFITVVGIILAYGIILGLMFKNKISPALQSLRYIQITIFLELFLLAITQHLDLLEWITGTLGIASIDISIMLLEKYISIQKAKNKNKKGNDHPNSNLYPTRKKQLEKFIPVLKQQEEEPYGIMISGEWGIGKTSFVKALEKKLKANSFIWIRAGSEKSVSETMLEISVKIIAVLEKNNIYIENTDVIKKYFLVFSDLTKYTALKPIKNIFNILTNSKSTNDQDYLNNKLDDLNKPIYLIIDDLDRCDSEYQEKMFKVIRESMNLHKCKTIFLVDRNKFLKEKYDANYIEKYVSYTLDLCEVDYQEIAVNSISEFLYSKYFDKVNSILLKGRNSSEILDMILYFPINLSEKFVDREQTENERLNQTKDKNQINSIQERIEKIKQTKQRIDKEITIPRKVKRYFKGIRRDIDKLNEGIEQIYGEFYNEDWLQAIIEVQFVQSFMSDIFNDIKLERDVLAFGQKDQTYAMDIVLNLSYEFVGQNEKKEAILNYLIYKLDVIDFKTVKTRREKYLFELHNGNAKISHLDDYISSASTYSNLSEILNLFEKQGLNNKGDFIGRIFEVLSDRFSPFKANTKEFLDFSKRLINCLTSRELSDSEKSLCIYGGKSILKKAISDNISIFIHILILVFGITSVETNRQGATITDLDEFYDILKKIDSASRFKGPDEGINKLSRIKTYYKNIEAELMKETKQNIDLDLEKKFFKLNMIFEICEFWDNIENTINCITTENAKPLLNKYFITESGYTTRKEVFDDVLNLIEALKILEEFYKTKKPTYQSKYSLLLLRLSYEIVIQYEGNSEWFKGKQKEIAKLLTENEKLIRMPDNIMDEYTEDCITQMKIYIYKFNEYCKES